MEFTTYAERIGERKGLKKGRLKGKQESLLQVLQARFKKVPERITVPVYALADADVLAEAVDYALRCDSLKDFEAMLSAK
jgi:hypothetical protein